MYAIRSYYAFKGGPAGFVRVVTPDTLVFPDYDGNGMFKSLGNIKAHPYVGLLFLAMDASVITSYSIHYTKLYEIIARSMPAQTAD